jgi:Ca2+-binding RTX toxin-like protein
VVVATLAATTMLGLAAANSVPGSKAADRTSTVTAEELKPTPDCSAIVLSALVTGSGTFGGGDPSELILGSSGADTISGGKGGDCIVAGGGDDSLNGGLGTDVCIGGPGNDTFNPTCETQIP